MLWTRGELVAEDARTFRFLLIPHLVFLGFFYAFGVGSSCVVRVLPIPLRAVPLPIPSRAVPLPILSRAVPLPNACLPFDPRPHRK